MISMLPADEMGGAQIFRCLDALGPGGKADLPRPSVEERPVATFIRIGFPEAPGDGLIGWRYLVIIPPG